MKKILLISVFCITAAMVLAQKPVAGDMSFTLGLTGLSDVTVTSNFGDMGTLLYRYYITDEWAARARLDLLISNNKSDFTAADTSGFGEHDITKSNMVNLHLGIQRNFGTSLKRLEPYMAAEIVFGTGKLNITDNTTDFDMSNSVEIKNEPGSTTNIGLVVDAGFNYFFTDHFAVGAEFGYGIQHSSTGEGLVTTTTTTGNVSTVTTSKSGTSSSFNLGGTGGTGLIMLTAAF